MVFVTTVDVEKHYPVLGKCVPPFQIEAAMANSRFDHLCNLKVSSKASAVRLSSIICTIGMACSDPAQIEELIDSGMNIAYVNAAYGTLDYHKELIGNVKAARKHYSKKIETICPVAIALGLKGPILRCYPGGSFCAEVTLEEGNFTKLSGDLLLIYQNDPSDIIYVNYEKIHEVLQRGSLLKIARGRVILSCIDINETIITCQVLKGGDVQSGYQVFLPDTPLELPVLTPRDRAILQLAIEQDIDVIFVPYVRNAAALQEVRQFLGDKNEMMIYAQIDNKEGVLNLDEIIAAADGILICRNHLGNEIDESQILTVQKTAIAKCMSASKPIISSFQFLESMVRNPVPTRAERCDVANAILDGVDCILLHHETCMGMYASQCVKLAGSICKEAEAAMWQKKIVTDLYTKIIAPTIATHAICIAAVQISFIILASAIVVTSSSLKSAKILSHYRPKCPIVAVTRNAKKARKAHLFRGIIPVFHKDHKMYTWEQEVQYRVACGINFGRKKGFIRVGDTVVVLTATGEGFGYTDNMKILKVVGRIHEQTCTC